jgi:hypothetical protein
MGFTEDAGADFFAGAAGAAFGLDATLAFSTAVGALVVDWAAGLAEVDFTGALDTLAAGLAFLAGADGGVAAGLALVSAGFLPDGAVAGVFRLAGTTVFLAAAFEGVFTSCLLAV